LANLLLNRYEIVKSLGSGGFGETFLAKDTQMPSQRLVVVKKLKPANASQNTSTELIATLFEKEAAVLEELGNHSSQIPKLYSYFCEENEFYLVQEYIAGQSLSQVGMIGTEQAKTILSSLLNTLKYIHSKGIIHRDIKPENIILRDGDRLPVLIDFGAVKETMGTITLGSGSMVSSVVIGTRGFMAPEQGAGRSIFSTDLYALGLTMIYAMTQKLPIEFATSHLTGELDWQGYIPNLDPHLAKVLDKAIKMEISGRYPTAEAMYQDLHSLIISSASKPANQMETIQVAPTPSNKFLKSNSSNIGTEIITPNSNVKSKNNDKEKSKISTLLTIAIGILVSGLGLGAGLLITQQVKEAEQRAIQAENDKKEAERKQKEAEQKILDEENRQKKLEQKRVEEERQKLAAQAAQARQERQKLAAERKRMESLARQAQSIAGGTSYGTIGGASGSKNIRSGPGTNYSVVTQGYTGDSVEILDSQTDTGGYVWYKIYHPNSESTGWMASQLIDF
jgi:serine/threonine-protein kinase